MNCGVVSCDGEMSAATQMHCMHTLISHIYAIRRFGSAVGSECMVFVFDCVRYMRIERSSVIVTTVLGTLSAHASYASSIHIHSAE